MLYGRVADGWEPPDRASVSRGPQLPPPHPRGSTPVYADVWQDLRAARGPGALVRQGPEEGQPVDAPPLAHAVGSAPGPWGCSCPLPHGSGRKAGGVGGAGWWRQPTTSMPSRATSCTMWTSIRYRWTS